MGFRSRFSRLERSPIGIRFQDEREFRLLAAPFAFVDSQREIPDQKVVRQRVLLDRVHVIAFEAFEQQFDFSRSSS